MNCTFVPPYLLRHLLQESDAAGSSRTLAVDQQLRERRENAPAEVRRGVIGAAASGRTVHDAQNTEDLPGTVVRSEGDPAVGDESVDEAYDSAGQVLQLFRTAFERDSTDGNGAPLSITVHFGVDYDNAFWDGTQLVFGDGDGVVFDRFTKPMDVMAHEFTHAVTQFTAGLVYSGQSGALNESVSDVFAAMTKQHSLAQTADQADWLIGAGIFLPDVSAKALRSMIEPGTAYDDPRIGRDPQVGSMADYVDTTQDNGGVHINSGIPNRAFALAAIELGGQSWERAGRVWYDALTGGGVEPRADFVAFAEATVASARRLFATDDSVVAAVQRAWETVGVLSPAEPDTPETEPPAPEPAADAPSEAPEGRQKVAVSRSGGIAGTTRTRELDLDADPAGDEIRHLLTRVETQHLSVSSMGADRFVYTVMHGSWEVTAPEHDLTPELHQIVQIVFERGR